MAEPEKQQWEDLAVETGRVFTPTTPIDEKSLFAGRTNQIRLIADVINQKGQHAILFGERGVGKTSLANVLSSVLSGHVSTIFAPRINCTMTDTFEDVWRRAFEAIQIQISHPGVGFRPAPRAIPADATEALGIPPGAPVTVDVVRRGLMILSRYATLIIIIDEFDRLDQEHRREFADMIKTLSDQAIAVTVVLVGVADSVGQLIQEHQSVQRALVQIHMQRMSKEEIAEIISKGFSMLGMTVAEPAAIRVTQLAQGFPHYAHLLGLYAGRHAIDERRLNVTLADVDAAIARAINDAQLSIRNEFKKAVQSIHKETLYPDVLLACAVANTDELGTFSAVDVRTALRNITQKDRDIPAFARHLGHFCSEERGNVLKKDGQVRRFRYRFTNPLLPPFVIMSGLHSGRIGPAALAGDWRPTEPVP